MPYFDEVGDAEITRVFTEPCDLLLGRKIYEIFTVDSDTLTGSRVADTRLVVAHYVRAAAVKTADAALTTPSDKERARQARLTREATVSPAPDLPR